MVTTKSVSRVVALEEAFLHPGVWDLFPESRNSCWTGMVPASIRQNPLADSERSVRGDEAGSQFRSIRTVSKSVPSARTIALLNRGRVASRAFVSSLGSR
jgi:hypothetical protein